MKKRTFILLAVILLIICSFSACGTERNIKDTPPEDNSQTITSNFEVIAGKEYLSFDTNTKVIWYMFSTREYIGYQGYGYSYFAPYVNENGKFCRYIDGEIVEITEDVENNVYD